jgi:hypothetical protein
MNSILKYSPMAVCRIDPAVFAAIKENRDARAILLSAFVAIAVGGICFGLACGIWRAPLQAWYAAVKMPAMILAVTLAGSLINTMLAQVLGTGLSFRQVWMCQGVGFAIAAAWLGGISPALLLFSLSAPAPAAAGGMTAYRVLLATLVVLVGLAGLWGNLRLYRLLRRLVGSPDKAWRLLIAWILVLGLAGSEISWITSPFVSRPDLSISFLNPHAFSSNFFENLWEIFVQQVPLGNPVLERHQL